MAIREILTYPNPILKETATDVDEFTSEIRQIINDMAETMYRAPGVGLAAPQLGILKNIIVVDVSAKEESSGLIALINPKIIKKEGMISFEEGCLSVPELLVKITRACDIVVAGLNPFGEKIEVECNGFLSVAIQHEMDHLMGKVILDYASYIKRSMYIKKIKKQNT